MISTKKKARKISKLNRSKIKPLQPFLIVGIGASAGGLPAFTEFLSQLPTDPNLALVIIQHLDPSHKSHLADLLAKSSRLPVIEIKNGQSVKPNHVYVIPPGADLEITGGILHLIPRQKNAKPPFHLPIDIFFKSLANDRGDQAVGIVLSGTGADGALGLQAIKAAGGHTFIQDIATAQFPDMPKAALSASEIDYALPCNAIAKQLVHLAKSMTSQRTSDKNDSDIFIGHEDQISRIFKILQEETGADFSRYKAATFQRRLLRRLKVHNDATLEEYLDVLNKDKTEAQALHREILIHVTSFFRDPEIFELLKTSILPKIIKDKPLNVPLRFWVPGCSTGEEVYSLAITVLEFLKNANLNYSLQIFGSDISEAVLEKARHGTYSEKDMIGVSPERQSLYFTKVAKDYQISKTIRESCIFAKQDLTQDPPFSKLDLISCRNLLIYFGSNLQDRTFAVFHFALNPCGFLVLGTAETACNFSNLFTAMDKKHKIYTKKSASSKLPTSILSSTPIKKLTLPKISTWNRFENFDLERITNRMMIDKFAPAGVVIDGDMTILRFQGQMRSFLDPNAGGASLNLMKMAPEGLVPDLNIAITKAKKTKLDVKKTGITILRDGKSTSVDIEVIPFQHPGTIETYFAVLFHDSENSLKRAASPKKGRLKNSSLQQELYEAKKRLQYLIEAEEINNQELRAANEEILSSNEELQCTNEEMETAKEELQSANEELTTINEELLNRNTDLTQTLAQLSDARDYSEMILKSILNPILVLNAELRVLKANDSFYQTFQVTPEETLHSFLFELGNGQWNILKLRNALETELPKMTEIRDLEVEYHFPHIGQKTMLLNANKVQLKEHGKMILLSILDITKQKENAATLYAGEICRALFDTTLDGVMTINNQGKCTEINDSMTKILHLPRSDLIGAPLEKCVKSEVTNAINPILDNKNVTDIYEQVTPLKTSEGKDRIVEWRFRANFIPGLHFLVARDVTDRIQAERLLQYTSLESIRISKLRQQFAAMTSHELRTPLTAIKEGIGLVIDELAGPLSDEQKEYLKISQNNVDRLARLVNNLLDVTRIDLGQFEMFFAEIDLKTLIGDTINLMKQVSTMKEIKLSCNLPIETVLAVCDADKIKQVIINLIDNAIKFTDKGGKITVSLERQKDTIHIRVSDTGVGIKEEDQLKIFEIFEQSLPGKLKQGGGFGIGLAVCRNIMDQHHGQITVQSHYGKGSQFTLSFPDNLILSKHESQVASIDSNNLPTKTVRKEPL